MKSQLMVFALSAILVASIGMAPAFGQIQSTIVVTTDKTSYSQGETIIVTGEVRDLYAGTPVSMIVTSPNSSIVAIDQITVGADKKFSTEVTAGGTMKTEGTYTVIVTYGSETRSAETTFEFGGSTAPPVEDVVSPDVTDTTVSVEGSTDLIGYEVTGGKLLGIMPDVDANSLIISIDATEDGSITLTVPRSVLDATFPDGGDDEFFVLIDGDEIGRAHV